MDKILSTRIDESVIKRISNLSHELKTSKKAIIEAAILTYAQKIEVEHKIDVFEQTWGAWQRAQSPKETVEQIKGEFLKSMRRHHK